MSTPSRGGEPTIAGYGRVDPMLENSRVLGEQVFTLAQDISTASKSALEATNAAIVGTELADEWPLTTDFVVHNVLLGRVEQRLKAYGLLAMSATPIPAEHAAAVSVESDAALTSTKYYDELLGDTYHSDNPRRDFTADLIKWADVMAESGWPTFVHLHLGESHRVAVAVYEGRDSVRDYLDVSTDASRISEEERAEGARPSIWASQRVLVSGETSSSEESRSKEVFDALDRASLHKRGYSTDYLIGDGLVVRVGYADGVSEDNTDLTVELRDEKSGGSGISLSVGQDVSRYQRRNHPYTTREWLGWTKEQRRQSRQLLRREDFSIPTVTLEPAAQAVSHAKPKQGGMLWEGATDVEPLPSTDIEYIRKLIQEFSKPLD